MSEPTTVTNELAAMRRVVAALDKLDVAARERVVGWLFDRYVRRVDDETAVKGRPSERRG